MHFGTRSPTDPLAAVAGILDAALVACEVALLASNPEVYNGANDDATRGSSFLRANAIIIQVRRLAALLAAYRDVLDREARRDARARSRQTF